MSRQRHLLTLLLSVSLAVAGTLEAQRPQTIGGMLAAARAAERPRTDANEQVTGPSLLIPAAGNLRGANGTYFRSDVTLIHYGSGPQKIAVGWMPANSGNCDAEVAEITLDQGWVHFDDFVGQTLGKSGLGALFFMPIDAAGELDESVQIDGFSRIWTPMPNAPPGTGSQQLSTVGADELFSNTHVYLFGLRQDAAFRTNIGIVNLDVTPHTWDAEYFPGSGTRPPDGSITVPPCSLWQGPIPAGNFGPLLVHLLPKEGGDRFWTAYGSSTDNSSGDGWIVMGRHPF